MMNDSWHANALSEDRESYQICSFYMPERLKRALQTEMPILRKARFLCIPAAIIAIFCPAALPQKAMIPGATHESADQISVESICSPRAQDSAKAALQLVCKKETLASESSLSSQTIVIGFVGGYASPTDLKHPEVLFAAFLRRHYAPNLQTQSVIRSDSIPWDHSLSHGEVY